MHCCAGIFNPFHSSQAQTFKGRIADSAVLYSQPVVKKDHWG
jgi:hypothetical protein